MLNRIPDGVRCKANNQPIDCKFLVVNYASSAILEDSKRIDSLTLFICCLLLVTRHFVAFQMHAPQSLDHGKSQSLCQRLFSPPSSTQSLSSCVLQSKVSAFQGYHATLTFLKHRTTSRGYLIHITIIVPHRAPNLLSCASRESTWQPQSNSRGYVASPFTK